MEVYHVIRDLVSLLVVGLLMIWGWRALNWVWLAPKRLERCLRQQGFAGNTYRFLFGDIKQLSTMNRQTRAKPMPLSDDIGPYVAPFLHQIVNQFLSTKTNREMKMKHRDIKESLREMIKRREKAIKAGEESNEDLLDILVESNIREMEAKNMGMSIEDVIEECKLFYFAGQETTSVLPVWTMVLLARYPDWQSKAREEVLHVLGDSKPNADGLNRLKVTMILYEVLRLYPSATELGRSVPKEIKLGNLLLPAGTEVSVPILLIHHDKDLWGDDAREFKPERFAEGVSKATKSQVTFLPFGWGPRICIGQNFAMMEAKMAVAMILQHFWFELSPSYAHTPCSMVTLRPQHGAQIILHKLGSN
ncbi:cytochrome P450 72A397-like [Gossypium arboreum]|uniref:cytochrome P450 72A397-like n=1 Tax=Gossypium arboreum TaxID=29729 RepID=UPI0022F1C90F|nr:cytochrome P450 72A397-like [Gossypium arboreum]